MATDFGILGELRVLQDGHPADLGPPRQRALLARLLIGPTMVSADRLIEDLWAGDPPDSARHVLHVYVSRLRRTLGDDGARLERQGSGYRLRFEADELDARQFEDLVGQARSAKTRGDVKAASEQLRSALELWRGPALVEFADEAFAREEAARLEELRVAAIEGRVWADLELGQALELVDELEALVSGHPYREGFAEQLMLALYRCGRQVEALRVYQSQRGRLAEDLGIDPGPALQRLQERVLAQDTELLAAPGPRAARDRRHLPLQRTSFVGREQELREAGTLLARSRVLTLTGPPGAGKTRLGLRVAEQSDGFSDGTFFVPLAAVGDPRFVASAVATALGLSESAEETPLDLTRAFLSERRVLLLLDNFEHVMEAARQVGDLLDSAPDLKVLVTSRSPLGLIGEQEYLVPALSLPPAGAELDVEAARACDAVALFKARARAIDPGFDIADADVEAIAEITRRLDGLPLAIELAAARIRLHTPQELLERLVRRLDVLTDRGLEVEDRHHTMRSAIAWSYELLKPAERALFRTLGVFRGGFSLAAAAYVGGGTDHEIAAGVESLLTKSLLQRPVSVGTARYAMLEMIREFALERLADAGELSVAADLHARYYARLAATIEPELTGDDPASAVDRLRSEVDDVRAALDHAITAGDADTGLELAAATWRYWQSTGQLKEGWYWLDRVLAVESASEPSRARGIEARAGLAYWLGDFESAKADYAEALTLYESAGDRSGEANARYCLSLVASFQDDPEAAERLARESRLIFEELGSEVQVGRALMAEATAAWKKGDLSRARRLHEQALQINLAIEDVVTASSQLVGMGGIAFQQGHPEQALLDVSRALDMAVESGNAHTQLFALDSLASLVASERPVEAVVLAGAACALREVHGGGWTLESFGVENARTIAAGVLTEDEIERAWAEGSEMSLEAAVELGRGLLA